MAGGRQWEHFRFMALLSRPKKARMVRSNLVKRHKRYQPRLLLRLTFNRGRLFKPTAIKGRHFLLTPSKLLYRNGLQRALDRGKGLSAMYRGRQPY